MEDPEFPDNWDTFGSGVEEALAPEPPDIMRDMAEMPNAIRNVCESLKRDYAYPNPQFHGKKR